MQPTRTLTSPMTRHRQQVLALLLGCSMCLLASCGAIKPPSANTAPQKQRPPPCQDDIAPADNVALTGIEQSIAQDKSHAALAQLDALNLKSPRAQLLRADAWRRVGRTADAERLYGTLLSSCLSGQAHHGLGLLLASTQTHVESLEHLQKARELMPTDAQVRNDLGYAFLLRRALPDARFEFMTAIELSPDFQRPRHNLYMLAALQNEDGAIKALARQWGMDPGTEASLQASARQLPRIAPPEPAKAGASRP